MATKTEGPTGSLRQFVFRVSASSVSGMRKESAVSVEKTSGEVMMQYEIASDESELLGGNNSAPPPLTYFTSSIAFCLMTQISRYANMRKLDIQDVRMTTVVHYRNEGSVLQGTVEGIVDSIESDIEIDSPEPHKIIETLVRDAERGCYVHYALTQPLTVTNRINQKIS